MFLIPPSNLELLRVWNYFVCLFFFPLAWRSMLHLSLKMIWHGLYAFIRTLEYLKGHAF